MTIWAWATAMSIAAATAAACVAPGARPRAAPAGTPASSVVAPDEGFRASPPPPGQARPFVPPEPRAITLSNGMRILVAERHSTGLTAAELVVRGGTAAFPSEPPVLMELMADATMHGTKQLTEHQIYELMNRRMFELRASVGEAWLSFRLRAPATSFDAALEAMREVVLEPAFPDRSVEVERQRRLGAAPRAAEDPFQIGRRNLRAAIFGPGHPYGRGPGVDEGVLARISRSDVVRVWRESLDPAEMTLVVAGDVDTAVVRERAEVLFGEMKRDPTLPARVPVPPPSPSPARLILVDRPGAVRAVVLCGAAAAPMDAPAHAAQLVLRALLGGMRSSAVEAHLHDELAATAFGRVELDARAGGGILWWQGDTAPERAAAVLATIEARVRELRGRGPGQGELAAARTYIQRARPRELETAIGVSEALANIAAYRLPVDDLAAQSARIDALSADAVRAATPEPDALKAVVVGDLKVLRASLLALGWRPVEEHDAAGRPVPVSAP